MTNAASVGMVDLVGVGLNATDTVIPLETYPLAGSKVEYSTAHILPGGQAATTVVACQQWGLKTRYVGKLGDDPAADLHHSEFARLGVDARIQSVPNCPSRQSLILVDPTGDRTVLWRRDQRLDMTAADLDRDWIVNARALHVDGYDIAAATQAASWARESGIPVIADLDEIYPGVDDLMEQVDYLIVSRDFPTRLMREPNLESALKAMQKRYKNTFAAATLGPDGVLAWDGHNFHYSRAYRVPALDTTGAGDIFHAGFIYALLQGWPLSQQLDFAGAAAAINCMSVGARGGIAAVANILNLMQAGHRYLPAYNFPADALSELSRK